jgi:hypothetical protein
MFNLEQAISEWRQQMLAAGITAPVPLEELEVHLREEIERQIKTGASPQQAFKATVLQMGEGKELKTEFVRGSGLRGLLEMELISKELDLKWGPVLHLVISTGMLLFIGGMALFKREGFSGMTSAERMSSLVAVTLFYLFSWAGYLGCKFFPVIPNKRTRLAIYVAGAVLLALSLMFFLINANYNMGQFTVAFLRAFLIPMGAFSSLILGLERAAQKKQRWSLRKTKGTICLTLNNPLQSGGKK